MCCLVHFKVSKKKASKISVWTLFPYLLKLTLRKHFPAFAYAYFYSITPSYVVPRIANYEFILMVKANPIIFDQIVIFKIHKSQIMFGTLTFIVAVGALNAFKILLVMCNCYVEFKYLTTK